MDKCFGIDYFADGGGGHPCLPAAIRLDTWLAYFTEINDLHYKHNLGNTMLPALRVP